MPNKVALKEEIRKIQNNKCVLTGDPLPEQTSLFDTDRKTPKSKGGIYLVDNTRNVDPVAHMKRHETYRERSPQEEKLKGLIDDRRQLIKLSTKISNQLLAYKRGTDHPRQSTVQFLEEQLKMTSEELAKQDRYITKFLSRMDDPLIKAALGVKGVGPMTVAHCLVYIDLTKARHASSLWSYTGLHTPSHMRYQKTVASGGNKTLRTVLYTMACAQIRLHGPYREVYDRVKARLEKSDNEVFSRNTQGCLVKTTWKDAKPSHRDGAAKRAIMKHFLADYWYVGRTLAGLPTTPIYAEAVLGGSHRTIMPEERGWVY